MKQYKWTPERIEQCLNLVSKGVSNKRITEIMGIGAHQVKYCKKRFSNRVNKEKCFADKSEFYCDALEFKKCKDCSFYKTLPQHKHDVEKANERLLEIK